jgi:hypothetical protein
MIEKAAASLSDTDALSAVTLFPAWRDGISVAVGERYEYGAKLYRCEQAHMTQTGWEPDKTPALWTEVAKPGEIPVWRQPTGAQDAYMVGDKVHYPTADDPIYSSLVDNNVWSPDTPGLWEMEE